MVCFCFVILPYFLLWTVLFDQIQFLSDIAESSNAAYWDIMWSVCMSLSHLCTLLDGIRCRLTGTRVVLNNTAWTGPNPAWEGVIWRQEHPVCNHATYCQITMACVKNYQPKCYIDIVVNLYINLPTYLFICTLCAIVHSYLNLLCVWVIGVI